MTTEARSAVECSEPDHARSWARAREGPLHTTVIVLVLAAVYLASAKLGLSFALAAEQVSPVWPPTGVALAAVLLFGRRVWPGIALGAFLANVGAHEPIATACGIAVGNTLEAIVAAWLLQRFVAFDFRLERIRDAMGLIVLAAGMSTVVSATIGVASLCLGSVALPDGGRAIAWSDFTWLWRVWWLGDAIGALVVAPLLITWAGRRDWRPLYRPLEAAALLAGLAATSAVVFFGDPATRLSATSLPYTIFPFVIWAALRFGPPATTLVTFIASTVTICATVQSLGPFGAGPVHERLLMLQIFMSVVASTGLLLAAALAERRQAEASLRRGEVELRLAVEQLQTLLDILPVGIFIAQDPRCDSITMNSAGAEMLRISQNVNASKSGPDAAALEFRLLKDGAEVPADELPMQRAARTRATVVGEELEVVRTDGTRRTLYEYASPLFDAAGRVRGCLGVAVDISERKRAEEALKQADRRKDEFLAMLAHELRNPLAPIRMGVDLLQLQEERDPEQAEIVELLDRQVQQLTRLVDDLMDVSRVTRGKIQLQRQPEDLATVIERAIETCQPLIDERGHQLSVALPADPLSIHADATRLTQVFANLINNAAKYTDHGGQIQLTAGRDGDEAVVRVIDAGKGIDREVLPHIFDLFVQGDRSVARAEGGLGIGLTLVRRLVDMHDGSIEVFSEGLGRGSCFVVRLPLAPQEEPVWAAPATTRDESAVAARSRLDLLVVDDNADAAQSLCLLLRMAGHQVRVAHSGAEALEAVKASPPAAVLLDIGMPGMNGYEVAQRLRSEPATQRIVLIAVSGWGQPSDQRRANDAGFDHHLTKPVDADVLHTVLSRLCEPAATTALGSPLG